MIQVVMVCFLVDNLRGKCCDAFVNEGYKNDCADLVAIILVKNILVNSCKLNGNTLYYA